MKCYGNTMAEQSVEQACDRDMAGWPNPFSGEGYYVIDMRCRYTSVVGCVGSSGCRLCHTEPETWEGTSGYPKCPSCVCDKWGIDHPGACMESA
jgi:hypothetical protein